MTCPRHPAGRAGTAASWSAPFPRPARGAPFPSALASSPRPRASSRRQEGRRDLRAGGGVIPRQTATPGGGPSSRAREAALGCPGGKDVGSGSEGQRRGPFSTPSWHWVGGIPAPRSPRPPHTCARPPAPSPPPRAGGRDAPAEPPTAGPAGPCWAGGASSPWSRSAAGVSRPPSPRPAGPPALEPTPAPARPSAPRPAPPRAPCGAPDLAASLWKSRVTASRT